MGGEHNSAGHEATRLRPALRLAEPPREAPRMRASVDEIVVGALGIEGACDLWARRAREIRANLHKADSALMRHAQLALAKRYEEKATRPLIRLVSGQDEVRIATGDPCRGLLLRARHRRRAPITQVFGAALVVGLGALRHL
jgi:hypothetical protein